MGKCFENQFYYDMKNKKQENIFQNSIIDEIYVHIELRKKEIVLFRWGNSNIAVNFMSNSKIE